MFRSAIAIITASVVTIGLIYGMYALIKMDEPELDDRTAIKLPDFVHVPKNEDLQVITAKPKAPDKIQDQPDIPEVEVVNKRVDVNTNLTLGAVKVGIVRELKGFNSNDGEYLPIFRAPAVYPRRAETNGYCGWVDLEFTVSSTGSVKDVVVLGSSKSLFEKNAKKAAEKYKYKPRQVDGKGVDVPGIRQRIIFTLAHEKGVRPDKSCVEPS